MQSNCHGSAQDYKHRSLQDAFIGKSVKKEPLAAVNKQRRTSAKLSLARVSLITAAGALACGGETALTRGMFRAATVQHDARILGNAFQRDLADRFYVGRRLLSFEANVADTGI